MNRRRSFRGGWLLGVLLGLSTWGALAQRTLVVQHGKIWLDGRPVEQEHLGERFHIPPDLSLQLQFFGDESPIFVLNGQFFQVKGDQVVPVAPPQLWGQDILTSGISVTADTSDRMAAVLAELIEQARALQEEAERVYRSVEHWQQIRTPELEQRLEIIRRQAAALSERMRLLPRLEWETYLMHMQRQDAELAYRLMEEWAWEQTLQQQASRIRQMPEGPERERAVAELRRQLEQIFERKQQNRRREIAQLEQQLRLLRERLNERERYRQQLIEQRLRELLGEY